MKGAPVADPLFPIPVIRNHVEQWVDDSGDTWAIVDGVETKIAYANPVALMKRQDGVRVEIRKALDETGIREKTVFQEITLEDGTKAVVELLPPGDANVLQWDETRRQQTIAPVTPLKRLTRWQRLKRAVTRCLNRKAPR